MLAGEVKLSVVASEGFSLDADRYLGLGADSALQSARESEERARRHLSVAQERVAREEEARKKSQELVDGGKVKLL